MAEAKLNFDEESLDKNSALYKLYSKYYQGMVFAGETTPPDFTTPPVTPEGNIDVDAINQSLADYSTILMKNSAYLFASTISDVYTGSSGGDGGDGELAGYLKKAGDSMTGELNALHGFKAGVGGVKIFETVGIDEETYALIVHKNLELNGSLKLENIVFKNLSSLSYSDERDMVVDANTFKLTGNISAGGYITVGAIKITSDKILYQETYNFYHEGNANQPTVDWQSKNMLVHNDLGVKNNVDILGELKVNDFYLGKIPSNDNEPERYMIYSEDLENGQKRLGLNSDLSIRPGYGIMFLDSYIISVRQGADNVVSFSASNMILNLGDNNTQEISLQTDIKNYNRTHTLITPNGDGFFPNSFKAGVGNSSSIVIETYSDSDSDGVWFKHNIKIGDEDNGVIVYSDISRHSLDGVLIYTRVNDNIQYKERIGFYLQYQATTSLLRSLDKEWSATLHLNTGAEFVCIDKPVESNMFSIASSQYKTHLKENVLFFNDEAYLEGLVDGIRYAGNAYFDGNIGSKSFASGFAGYGWSIQENKLYGGISATFDELTVRRKMRIYELEVQKQNIVNGSYWVSNSCSGDRVEEIL